MSELHDAPNQQVVRADGSGPADEGTGGEPGELQPEQAAGGEAETDLDAMTKADMLEMAKSLDVTPANNDMTKEELRAAIEAKLGR